MGRHDELAAPLYAGLEGHHLAPEHLLPSLLRAGIAKVRVGLGVAVAGEVLDAARHACILQSLQIAGHHRGGYLRIVAEGTCTNDDVLRIGIHVGHGGEVDVETIVLQIGADGVATLVGILWVARGADGPHRLVGLHVEVAVAANAGHAATLLVDTQQG